jgi:hypothetical protein
MEVIDPNKGHSHPYGMPGLFDEFTTSQKSRRAVNKRANRITETKRVAAIFARGMCTPERDIFSLSGFNLI